MRDDSLNATRGNLFIIPDETDEDEKTGPQSEEASDNEGMMRPLPLPQEEEEEEKSIHTPSTAAAATTATTTRATATTGQEDPPEPSSTEASVHRYLELKMKNSPFFEAHPVTALPVLDLDEITLGCFLGQGEFGRVYEVSQIVDKADEGKRESRHSIQELLEQSHAILEDLPPTTTESVKTVIQHDVSERTHTTTYLCLEEDTASETDNYANTTNAGGSTDTANNGKEKDSPEKEETSNGDKVAAVVVVDSEVVKRSRTILKKRCWKDGKARYAAKQLRKDLGQSPYNHQHRNNNKNNNHHNEDEEEDTTTIMPVVGAMDLAFEGRLLASLAHPNIVKLRATAGLPGQPEYTLLLDRLHMTLDDKIAEWTHELGGPGATRSTRSKPLKKLFSKVVEGSNQKNLRRLQKQGQFLRRLYAAFDVARALRYLHENNIVFRDLKPQNIGYDLRDDVKLFDFGLAKELLEEDIVQFPDGYNATGMTGTLRWMSPEVYFSRPYGLLADIYSFGLLLWNLCYLEIPFSKNSHLKSFHRNVMAKGKRPCRLPSSLVSDSLWSTMSLCWSVDPAERPDFAIVCDVLRNEISTLRNTVQSSSELTFSGLAAGSTTIGSSTLDMMDESKVVEGQRRTTIPNKATKSRRKLPKVLRASFIKAPDPLDMSCHHNGPTRGLSPSQLAELNRHGRQSSQPLVDRRYSDVTRRSEYLEEKSALSLANVRLSSYSHRSSGKNSNPLQ